MSVYNQCRDRGVPSAAGNWIAILTILLLAIGRAYCGNWLYIRLLS